MTCSLSRGLARDSHVRELSWFAGKRDNPRIASCFINLAGLTVNHTHHNHLETCTREANPWSQNYLSDPSFPDMPAEISQDSLPLLPSQYHNENPYSADQKDYLQVLLLAMHFVKAVMANDRQSSGDMGSSPEPHRKAYPIPSCVTSQHPAGTKGASSSSPNDPLAALRRFSVGGRCCSL